MYTIVCVDGCGTFRPASFTPVTRDISSSARACCVSCVVCLALDDGAPTALWAPAPSTDRVSCGTRAHDVWRRVIRRRPRMD